MFKKILVAGLLAVVVVAAAFSIYNTSFAAKPEAVSAANDAAVAQGYGHGNGQSAVQSYGQGNVQGAGQSRGSQGDSTGTGIPSPENGLTEWVSFSGEITAVALPQFTLLTGDGQEIPAEVGNISYVGQLGLVLEVGDQVSVVGFWDTNGGFALKSLTLDETGETFELRDDYGRPLWSGGNGRGGHSQP